MIWRLRPVILYRDLVLHNICIPRRFPRKGVKLRGRQRRLMLKKSDLSLNLFIFTLI